MVKESRRAQITWSLKLGTNKRAVPIWWVDVKDFQMGNPINNPLYIFELVTLGNSIKNYMLGKV